jgi:hypothetical protein
MEVKVKAGDLHHHLLLMLQEIPHHAAGRIFTFTDRPRRKQLITRLEIISVEASGRAACDMTTNEYLVPIQSDRGQLSSRNLRSD